MAFQRSTHEGLRELALFAGAGGGILGGKLLGWRTVCAVERDAYAAAVLAQRQNDGILAPFPIWSDITTFDGRPWRGIVDMVSGGFPCQAYSTAASGKNVAADLWPDMLRVVADVAPRSVFAENVSAQAIDAACDDLEALGFQTRAISFSAADVGADHIRERFWLLAYADNESKLLCRQYAKMALGDEFQTCIWETFPAASRVDDGVAHRMERYKATGNGQLPIVAAAAFAALSESD